MKNVINRRGVTVAVAALVIIVAHYTGLLSWSESGAARLLNPVAGLFFRGGSRLTQLYRDAGDRRSLQEENEALAARVNELLAANAGMHILAEENEALREQLSFYTRTGYRKQLAHSVSRVNDAAGTQIITLDAGTADGVRAGQAVVSGNGLVIGKIVSTSERLAHACLLTDAACHLAASVVGGKTLSGMTQGELGLTVRLDFVPQEETLAAGAVIITSGLEPGIPAGLVIGTVQEIRNEANNLFQTAVIAPAADMHDINIVSVIIQ